jgi:hypothetical protein
MSTQEFKHSPEEARKLWVQALRSGRFRQGRRYLRKGDQYCCLGVACELFMQHETPLPTELREHGKVAYNASTACAPRVVQRWMGLADDTGIYGDFDRSLAGHNDNGESFEKIADIIESRPTGLFVEPQQ